MDDLKVSFRLGDIYFQEKRDLNLLNLEKMRQLFFSWEKQLMESSGRHFLNLELQTNLNEVIKLSVQTKKESQPVSG